MVNRVGQVQRGLATALPLIRPTTLQYARIGAGGTDWEATMVRMAPILLVAVGLAACDAVTEGFNHAKAVETDLEGSTGLRPQVGFTWNNGRLTSVTVTYPRLNESKPLLELAATIREAVTKEFKQKPARIVVAFALEG